LSGIFIGLALVLLGLVGGSYQRRGVGYVVSGGELVWLGLFLAGFGAVLYLVLRARRN